MPYFSTLGGADVPYPSGADVPWITFMSPSPNGHYGDISDLALDPFFGESQKRFVVVARQRLRLQPNVKIALAGVRIDARVELAELFDGCGREVLDRGRCGQPTPYLIR